MGRIKKFLKRALWPDPLGYDDPGNDPMSCPAITFPAIDAAFYQKLYAQAVSAGVRFDGSRAEIDGIILSWDYDSDAQTLTVVCTKKPFLSSCGEIDSRLNDLIHKAKIEGV